MKKLRQSKKFFQSINLTSTIHCAHKTQKLHKTIRKTHRKTKTTYIEPTSLLYEAHTHTTIEHSENGYGRMRDVALRMSDLFR